MPNLHPVRALHTTLALATLLALPACGGDDALNTRAVTEGTRTTLALLETSDLHRDASAAERYLMEAEHALKHSRTWPRAGARRAWHGACR